MKTSRTLIAVAVAALIPLGAAVAGDKDKTGYGSASFDTLDTNRDGKISQVEASADTTIVFSKADANGDGYLDKSEWKNRAKETTPPAPQSMEPPVDPAASPSDQPASEPGPDTETPPQ